MDGSQENKSNSLKESEIFSTEKTVVSIHDNTLQKPAVPQKKANWLPRGYALQEGRLQLNIRRNFLIVKAAWQWNHSSPLMAVFKQKLHNWGQLPTFIGEVLALHVLHWESAQMDEDYSLKYLHLAFWNLSGAPGGSQHRTKQQTKQEGSINRVAQT